MASSVSRDPGLVPAPLALGLPYTCPEKCLWGKEFGGLLGLPSSLWAEGGLSGRALVRLLCKLSGKVAVLSEKGLGAG